MDDALAQAEHGRGDQQPSAPEHQRGSGPVGAAGPPAEGESADQQDQRARQQPRDLAAEVGVEHAEQPGRSPAPGAAGRAAADAARLVAGQAAETVVTEDEVEQAVVLRTADVRAVGGRRELHGQHPPTRRSQHGQPADGQLPDPHQHRPRPRQEVGAGEDRHHHERLQHLGQEAEADHRAGQHEPFGAPVFGRPHHEVGAQREQQHQHGVGVVEPEHQCRHRRRGQYRAGQQRGPRREPPAHGGVEQADGRHSLQRLGHQDRPRAEAEDAGPEDAQPSPPPFTICPTPLQGKAGHRPLPVVPLFSVGGPVALDVLGPVQHLARRHGQTPCVVFETTATRTRG